MEDRIKDQGYCRQTATVEGGDYRRKGYSITHQFRKSTKMAKAERNMVRANYHVIRSLHELKDKIFMAPSLEDEFKKANSLRYLNRLRTSREDAKMIADRGGVVLVRYNGGSYHYAYNIKGSIWLTAKPVEVCPMGVINIRLKDKIAGSYRSYYDGKNSFLFDEMYMQPKSKHITTTGNRLMAPVLSMRDYMDMIAADPYDAMFDKCGDGRNSPLRDIDDYHMYSKNITSDQCNTLDKLLKDFNEGRIVTKRSIVVAPSKYITSDTYLGKSTASIKSFSKTKKCSFFYMSICSFLGSEYIDEICHKKDNAYVHLKCPSEGRSFILKAAYSDDGKADLFVLLRSESSYYISDEKYMGAILDYGFRLVFNDICDKFPFIRKSSTKKKPK